MTDRTSFVIVAASLLVLAGIGLFVADPGLLPRTRADSATVPPIETTVATTPPTTESQWTDGVRFAFRVDGIEACGRTCRDVTATLVNTGDEPASDVEITVTLLVDGDAIWSDTRSLGTLDPGESFSGMERVEVGVDEAYGIQANGGTVTVRIRVEFDGGERVIETRETVA